MDNDLRNSGLLFVKPTLPIPAKAHTHLIVYHCRGGFETRPYKLLPPLYKRGGEGEFEVSFRGRTGGFRACPELAEGGVLSFSLKQSLIRIGKSRGITLWRGNWGCPPILLKSPEYGGFRGLVELYQILSNYLPY